MYKAEIEDICQYIKENNDTFPEFKGKVRNYAFCRWTQLKLPILTDKELFDTFNNIIYPKIRMILGVTNEETL